ncbi:DUF502 domain-containing protein [Magnetospirillum sulfuroxidans]|uniref:DUF502 domain-containing protein n=1 Tax=Magnetospirillum sulfuroxidans TaxID=611300 RepID=A0ABS5I861_9PROT|nr:DUF502 domain-containing protein [Magnetospirillum sulfuroxidans]MBR9970611.1 DUF502 domain-containing protein [Magnetospirillum sulfuroxidans]
MSEQNQESPAKKAKGVPFHIGLMARLRAYFFAGILVTAPVSITFYLAWQFIKFMDNQVSPLVPPEINPQYWGFPGFGLIAVIVGLTLIGMLTAGFVGRFLVRVYDIFLQRMPVLSGIYSAVKQIFETMLAQKANAFREVALIEYPRKGMWTMAFITGRTSGEIGTMFAEDMVNVFVPTTPNPTSGFLLFLPRSEVRVLDMNVEEGLKMVISTGILVPPNRKNADQPELSLT